MVSGISIWDLFRWVIALTALWLIASIPGYWLFGAWAHLRLALKATLGSVVPVAGRARRHHTVSDARDELMARVRLFEINRTAADAWQQTLVVMLEGVRAGGAQIQAARDAAVQSTQNLERIAQQAHRLRLVSTLVPAIPAMDDVLQRARGNRSALINLVASVGLFVPIAFANAQLTGLVLQETIPPVQPIFNLPVAFVLALVIVIAEAAIGLLHSAEADAREGSGRRLTVLSVVWTVAAVGVVAIETMLYSRVQSDSATFNLPLGISAFGLVGALLGASVFGLGRLAHRSVVTLRRDQAPKAVARQLRALAEAADQWNLVAARLQPAQQACIEAFDRLIGLSQQTSHAQAFAIQEFTHQIEGFRESAPTWARPAERALSASEFGERESQAYLWSGIALIATVTLGIICAHLGERMQTGAATGIGIGIAAVAFATGAFGALHAPANRLVRVAWHVVLIAIVTLSAAASVALLRDGIDAYAVVPLVPALAAFAAGYQSGPTGQLLRLPLLWIGHRVVDVALFLTIALLWVVHIGAVLVECLVRVVAWPTLAVLATVRSERPQQLDKRAA